MTSDWPDGETTLDSPDAPEAAARLRRPALTVLWHPDVRRVGHRVRLPGPGMALELSRARPAFWSVGGQDWGPLGDPYMSRRPIELVWTREGGVLIRTSPAGKLEVDGHAVSHELLVEAGRLERGVVLHLARRVLVLLHPLGPLERPRPELGMVGASDALEATRDEVARLAPLTVPVLIRGESGCGKELVARALHATGPRASRPFVAVNMATLAPGTAQSELFGHTRGAFTGAVQASRGLFERADRGTLLLDEIGVADTTVQAMLLRALETSQVQPVGGGVSRDVDVRVVAATDARLDAMLAAETFSAPLYHRLAGYTIELPPLRERRDDLGRLLLAFLRDALGELGAADRLQLPEPRATPWLASTLVERLALHHWPGNIRELRNTARQVAVASHDRPTASIPRALDASLGLAMAPKPATAADPEVSPSPEPPRSPARLRPSEISDDQLLAALQAEGWAIRPTARALNISKTSLYGLIDRCPLIRRAGDLSDDELRAAAAAHGHDVDTMAAALQVSPAGLRLRLRALD